MQNKPVAIITGASRGIGKAVALNFAKQGYDCALVATNEALLTDVSHSIKEQYDVNTGVFAIDVTDKKAVDVMVQQVLEAHGRIDVLFNNAGVMHPGTSELSPEDFDHMYQVNVLGSFHFIHAVAPHMKEKRSGYIMNLASRAGKVALAGSGGYAASKFAMVGLSESLFNEMLDFNVKVTCICPSVIDTDMTAGFTGFPDKEKIHVDDIVETVNFLLALSPTATVKDIDVMNTFFAKVMAKLKLDQDEE